MSLDLSVQPEPPDSADALALIGALDDHLGRLYRPENRHGLPVAALQDESVTFLVARLNGVAVGCGAVKSVGGEYAEVKRMYVGPPWRGRGVAQALLGHLERVSRRNGFRLLRLETGIYQPEAVRLYERAGFSRRPAFGEYAEDGVSLCYEKVLAPTQEEAEAAHTDDYEETTHAMPHTTDGPENPGGLAIAPALCGLCGALAVTLVNETARRFVPHAPRLDELGIRGFAKAFRRAGQTPPSRDKLYWLSMAGDLASNSAFYSLAARAAPDAVLKRGVLLGLAAGVGAVVLPKPMGLGGGPTARAIPTAAMTIAWYLLGGLAAAGAARLLAEK